MKTKEQAVLYSRNYRATHPRCHIPIRRLKQKFLAWIKRGVGCTDCGYNDSAWALDFDHVRGQKVTSLGVTVVTKGWAMILAELPKCEVVCANCHRIRTETRRGSIAL